MTAAAAWSYANETKGIQVTRETVRNREDDKEEEEWEGLRVVRNIPGRVFFRKMLEVGVEGPGQGDRDIMDRLRRAFFEIQ